MRFVIKTFYLSGIVIHILVGQIFASDSTVEKKDYPIPYPNRSMYLTSGIVGALGFGIYRVTGRYTLDGKTYKASSVFQWQGEGSFYYKPFLSGGISSKIIAGEPTVNSTMVDNRYMAFIRFHNRIKNFAVFMGPTIGLHNQSIEADASEDIEKGIDLSIPAMRYGLELGAGLRLNNALGLTAGTEVEHSITEEYLIRYSTGVAVNILFLWPHLGRLAKGFYWMFEYKFAQVKDYSNFQRDNETIYMMGNAVAF